MSRREEEKKEEGREWEERERKERRRREAYLHPLPVGGEEMGSLQTALPC